MKCPNCHFENPEGMKFCGECGARLERKCPKCNSPNPLQFNFCEECGHDLRKPEESAPIDYNEPQSYTPKHLADKILSNYTAIEGERKLVTMLFADAANSTAMFENLDPATSTRLWTGDLGFSWRIITFTGWHTG